MSTEVKIKEIAFVYHPVADIDRARAFYGRLLGLKVLMEIEIAPGMWWIEYNIAGAALAADGRSVMLRLTGPVEGSAVALTVSGLRDRSPNANVQTGQTLKVQTVASSYRHAAAVPAAGAEIKASGLPARRDQAWTMNVFVRASQPPDNRTLIAGFGRCEDKTNGTGRYFGSFANGLHLWVRGADVESTTPLALGRWQMLTATYDGQALRLYQDGRLIGWTEATLADDETVVRLLPLDPWDKQRRFQGEIRGFTVWSSALPAEMLELLAAIGAEP